MVKRFSKTKINDRRVDGLKAGECLADTELPGFFVRRQRGTTSYFIRKYLRGKRHFKTVGRHGPDALNTEQARERAGKMIDALSQANDLSQNFSVDQEMADQAPLRRRTNRIAKLVGLKYPLLPFEDRQRELAQVTGLSADYVLVLVRERERRDEFAALQSASLDDIDRQIREQLEVPDCERWFNKDQASADFEHWLRCATWTVEEAVALSLGKNPDWVSWDALKQYAGHSAFAELYRKRLDLTRRAIAASKLREPILPAQYVSWAQHLELDLPERLFAFTDRCNANLGAEVCGSDAELEKAKAELADCRQKMKDPNRRRLASYQRLVLILAAIHYGYRTGSIRQEAAVKIAAMSGSGELEISDGTVLSVLREAAADLECDDTELDLLLAEVGKS